MQKTFSPGSPNRHMVPRLHPEKTFRRPHVAVFVAATLTSSAVPHNNCRTLSSRQTQRASIRSDPVRPLSDDPAMMRRLLVTTMPWRSQLYLNDLTCAAALVESPSNPTAVDMFSASSGWVWALRTAGRVGVPPGPECGACSAVTFGVAAHICHMRSALFLRRATPPTQPILECSSGLAAFDVGRGRHGAAAPARLFFAAVMAGGETGTG